MKRDLGGVSRLLLPFAVVLCLSACLHNTLAQDLAWERWQQCASFPNVTLKEIRPDGQIWVTWYDVGQLATWQACERKAAASQAAKGRVAQSVAEPATPTTLPPAVVPEWRRGYEWAFRWESPRGSGTFVRSFDRVESLGGTEFYVTKGGHDENYWRRADLAFHMTKRSGEVELRRTPPQTWYVWPLTVGASWDQTYKSERPAEKTVIEITMTCSVKPPERVAVPAGTFDTFPTECQNKRTGRVMARLWYAPTVSHWVKQEDFFDYGKLERELIAFRIPQERRARAASVVPEVPMTSRQNVTETAASWRTAADAGDARAMARLGFMYFAGQGGLKKDDAEAVRWFFKGSGAGDGSAMAFLGSSYWTGLGGLSRDQVEAVRWFRKGASAGDGRAMAMLGQAHLTGIVGLAKDEAEAVRWFQKGADAGDGRAMVLLGETYLTGGGGLAQENAEAVRWIRRAAEAGDGFAMATLGSLYEAGEAGLTKDEAEAVRWYRTGAAAASGRAMAALGDMYATGRGGLTKNETEAVRWYREGAGLLDGVAMFRLGEVYESGRGLAKDRAEAARWYGRAASFGVPAAFDRLVALEEQRSE